MDAAEVAAPAWWRRRGLLWAGGAVAVLVVALALGEWARWPFLAAPLERALSAALHRSVRIGGVADAQSPTPRGFGVRFLGGVRLEAPELEIAAPAWSKAPHMLLARDVVLELRYGDLWRAWRGAPMRIHSLRARTLDGELERQADGRSSWQFGPPPAPGAEAVVAPGFGRVNVERGTLRYRDDVLRTELQARMHLADGEGPAPVFTLSANGHFRKRPVTIALTSAGVLPWVADEMPALPVALTLDARVGRAELKFNGSAVDALHGRGLTGRFELKGPSLAAVGDPVGVTLPTTAAFRSAGQVSKSADIWNVVVTDATVGASRLNGKFSYDTGRPVPLLSGQLGGARLMLKDLGPVVGTTTVVPAAVVAAVEPAVPVSPAAAAASAPATLVAKTRAPGRVLPARPFDLPALRAMDADVRVDIAEVDLNTSYLEPLRPLRTHLKLSGGVLTLGELDARMAQGRLTGVLELDGRATVALWNAKLRWQDVLLERWVRQQRAQEGAPPFVSGRLSGRADLQGKGRSTADILASLQGTLRAELRQGAVSHLMLEAMGLDIAEGLGMLIKGDETLPVQCAVADLAAQAGVLRPKTMVVDTRDSVVWVEGSVSMVTETLDLRTVVAPRDFSLLTVRTPVRVRGPFVKPELSLEKAPLARKVGAALLLSLINPLAALIPFVDPGNDAAAERGAAGCQALVARAASRAASAAPPR